MSALIMTYLTILGFLGLITLPVTGPAVITAGHIIRRRLDQMTRVSEVPAY
jgi:hypothetical protein